MKTELQGLCPSIRPVQALAASIYLLAAVLFVSCTAEVDKTDRSTEKAGSANKREVLLSFKNKLTVKTTKAETKADAPITTEAENEIATLDIYVFGAKAEGDTYTFRERFSYRQDGSALPAGAKELNLTPSTDNATTTALLELQKGLFVRLYCIANQTDLINPVDGNIVADTYFAPLTYDIETGILTDGIPTELQFQKYHSPLLTNASPALDLPLPMTGAQTTPIDLTDFGSSARVQVGFKLTRTMARFDISNAETESKFHLKSISMGNGRRGTAFFPVKVYGATPAVDGELITYPARTFEGEKANTGLQVSAFYSYPSPLEDKGYLILNGTYRVNQTEAKEVSYQIPFKQQTADGGLVELEINPNHRYTIGITKADEYRLDFNLTVENWTDEGNIDNYNPENEEKINFTVTIPALDLNSQYESKTQTVTLSLAPGSYFDMAISSKTELTMKKSYVGGLEYQKYDWLNVEIAPQTAMNKNILENNYNCKVSLKSDYTGDRYPKAVLRFLNIIDGTEDVFFVEPLSAPQVIEATAAGEGNFNKFDKEHSIASMYHTAECGMQLKVVCMEDIAITNPEWLDITKVSENNREHVYELKLKDADTTSPGDEGILTLKNSKFENLATDITIKLLATDITASDQNITAANSGNTNFPVISPEGYTVSVLNNNWNGGGSWFDISGSSSTGGTDYVGINQRNNQSTIMKPVIIHLANKIKGGKDKDITITPVGFATPSLSSSSGTLNNVRNENTTSLSFTVTPPSGSYEYTGISNSNIASVKQDGNKFTVTARYKGNTYINFRNKSDNSQTVSYRITVSRDYNGNAVWKYNGFYIAAQDAGTSAWRPDLTTAFCSNKSGANWYVPNANEWVTIIGATGFYPINSTGSTFQSLINNGVFNSGYHRSTTGGDQPYVMGFYSDKANVGPVNASDQAKVRCVSK